MFQPSRNAPTQHGKPQQPVAAWDTSAVDPPSGRRSQSLLLGGGVGHGEQQHGEREGELTKPLCCGLARRCEVGLAQGRFLRQFTISESHHISRLNCLWFESLACGDFVCFFQSCIKKLEAGSPRPLPSPSVIQRRITDIDQKKEELKIEVGMFRLLHSGGFNKDQVEGLI